MSNNNDNVGNSRLVSAFYWKFLERFGARFGAFILQLVLARLLEPEHYGTLSMMIIFTNLANIFIQKGFNSALIQNKDVTEDDYSSVFWVTIIVAVIMYIILFISAPWIAIAFEMPDLTWPFRALCLVLFPGALNSIQLAKISKNMKFKKVFVGNIAAMIISGVVGIILAYSGAGLWSLVANNALNVTVACIVMWFTVKWRPKFVCDFARIKVLFSFGWKILVSGLLDTLYQDLRSLVIGIKYNSKTLGFYNKGKNFPNFIITVVNTTVQTVMLPAMSEKQSEPEKLRSMMRNSIRISSYIIFPIMAGLAAVGTPLVRVLLTEKWLPCVPYMQIYCFTLAFHPVHSCNLQAINAIGRSDIFLKLEIIKKSYGLITLVIATLFFETPIAIAMTGAITTVISCFVNALPNKKLIGYSFSQQVMDILPALLMSMAMFGVVLVVQLLNLNDMITLLLQGVLGITVYVVLSVVFRIKSFNILFNTLRGTLKKKFSK